MSANSSSDSLERLLALENNNTPARTGLARAECGRRSSVMDLVRKLSSLGISGSPCAPTSTPAKVPIQVSACEDSQESSVAEDAEEPNTSGLERLKRKLEERFHMDFSVRGRRPFDDEAVGVILEHVDQPGRNLEADVDELCRMKTPLRNRCRRSSYFVDSPVQAEAGSPCPELYDPMEEDNCSLLERTATFISRYYCILKKARRSVDTSMSQQEKIEKVRLSLNQEFRDTVTQDQKERILESCIQRIDDLEVDDEDIDANNNDVEKLETSSHQHRGVECITLSDSPYVQGKICKARQNPDPDPRPGESSGGASEEVVELDTSDCLSLYVDSNFLDLSSEQSKEDSSDSDPVGINADFEGSPLMDQTQPNETSRDPEMIRNFYFKTPEARTYQGSPTSSLHYTEPDSTSAGSPSFSNSDKEDYLEDDPEEDSMRVGISSDCDSLSNPDTVWTSAGSPSIINSKEGDDPANESEEDSMRGSRISDCDNVDDSSADLDQSFLAFADEKSEPEAKEVEQVPGSVQ